MSKRYFYRESFIDRAIQFTRSFVLGRIPLKNACLIYEILKSQTLFPSQNFTDKEIQCNRSFVV